jgi:hypothetical protein
MLVVLLHNEVVYSAMDEKAAFVTRLFLRQDEDIVKSEAMSVQDFIYVPIG